MRRYYPSDHHGGSRFRIRLLAFISLTREMARELTSFLDSWLIQLCAPTGCHKYACSMECSRSQVPEGWWPFLDKRSGGERSEPHSLCTIFSYIIFFWPLHLSATIQPVIFAGKIHLLNFSQWTPDKFYLPYFSHSVTFWQHEFLLHVKSKMYGRPSHVERYQALLILSSAVYNSSLISYMHLQMNLLSYFRVLLWHKPDLTAPLTVFCCNCRSQCCWE